MRKELLVPVEPHQEDVVTLVAGRTTPAHIQHVRLSVPDPKLSIRRRILKYQEFRIRIPLQLAM